MKHELIQPIRGIIPPLVTPLTDTCQLDVAGLERLIEHVLDGGVHGLFLLGTTGEGPSLPLKVQHSLVRHACRLVDRRVPLLVSISHSCVAESLELANFAADLGCDAVVATPPYFFPLPQSDVLKYYQQLIPSLPLPLMLYNMPAVTGTHIEYETAQRLAEQECVLGIKDSSGSLDTFKQFIELTKARPDFSVLVGPEHLLGTTLAMGGSGGVSGGANVWPQVFVGLYDASLNNLQQAVAQLSRSIDDFGEIYRVGPVSIPAIIARTKSALSNRNICSDTTATPIHRVTPAEKERIDAILNQLALAGHHDNAKLPLRG
ncbi:MAG: dihydrodipicolinate synthase family protein [Bythopirellula sp.]